MYLAGAITSPLLMFCGAVIPSKDIPGYMRWACKIMYTKYSLDSIYKNIFMNRQPMECHRKFCFFTNSEKFLQFKGVTGDKSTDYWVMLGFLLFFRIIGFILLYIKASQKR